MATWTPKQLGWSQVEPMVFGAQRQLSLRLKLLRRHLLKSSAAVFRLERIYDIIEAFEENPNKILSKAIPKAAEYVRQRMRTHFARERDAWGHKWAPIGRYTALIHQRAWGRPKKKLGVWSGGLLKRLNRRPSGGKHQFFNLTVREKKVRLVLGASLARYEPAIMFQTRGLATRFGKVLGTRPARNFMSLAKWERNRVKKILMKPVRELFKELGIGAVMEEALGKDPEARMKGLPGALVMGEAEAEAVTKAGFVPKYKDLVENQKFEPKEILVQEKGHWYRVRVTSQYEQKLYALRGKIAQTKAEHFIEKTPPGIDEKTGKWTRGKLVGRAKAEQAYKDRDRKFQRTMRSRGKFVPDTAEAAAKREAKYRPGKKKIVPRRRKETPRERQQRMDYERKQGRTGPLDRWRKDPHQAARAEERARRRPAKNLLGKTTKSLIDNWSDELEGLQFLERVQYHLEEHQRRSWRKMKGLGKRGKKGLGEATLGNLLGKLKPKRRRK